jgi:hypothetical protein
MDARERNTALIWRRAEMLGASDVVLIAAITAASSVFAPVLLLIFNNRAQRSLKKQDWDRQDAVAAQAAEAARLLLARQETIAAKAREAAGLLVESNERVADAARAATQETNGKLDVIHKLVDGHMTESMQSEHDATKRELVLLLHVVELNKAMNRDPGIDALAEIEATRKKIAELGAKLAERLRQVQLAEQNIASPT